MFFYYVAQVRLDCTMDGPFYSQIKIFDIRKNMYGLTINMKS